MNSWTCWCGTRPVNSRLRQQLGLAGNTVLGFLGSFYAYEGLALLIDVLPAICASRPDVRLLLVGGGYQEEALKAQCARLGLEGKVVFTGRVPHQEVREFYELVDVLVYPRLSMRLTELVTPLKPLEALAQGKLVLASDIGGHRELIRHGETGFLFPAGDANALAAAVLDLLGQPGIWPRIREAGERFITEERSWAAVAERYRTVYESVLTTRARG